METVAYQCVSYLKNTVSRPAYRVTFLLAIVVFLGCHSSTSMAHSETETSSDELTPVENVPAPTSEESETLGSDTSVVPAEEGERENGDETTTGQPDITPAIEGSDSTESKSNTREEASDESEIEQVTKVAILVQGIEGALKPIRGAEVFVSIEDHADMQTFTNAKGLANIDLPSGRVKIQVTAKAWKTFGDFYDLKGEMEEIQITLESRKPGEK